MVLPDPPSDAVPGHRPDILAGSRPDAGAAPGSAPATDPVADDLLATVARTLDAGTGTVHVLADDGLLHLRGLLGTMPPPVLAAITTIPIGKGIAGLTVQRAEPVDLCNLQTDSSGAARPGAKATGVGGSVCVPILDGERAVGAVGVGTTHEHEFTDAEIARLSAAAQGIGRALGLISRS